MLHMGYLHTAPVHALLGLELLQESAGAAADIEQVRALQPDACDNDEIDGFAARHLELRWDECRPLGLACMKGHSRSPSPAGGQAQ